MTYKILAVVLAVVLGPVIGAILSGLDRKITARIQGRVGPPILQPIYDLIKLFQKQPLAVNQFQILYAYLHLAFMLVVVVLLVLGQDMLMILFAHAFSSLALILGGMSVRSPYSRIGAQRKILQMLAYEPILILMIVGIYLANKSQGLSHPFMASTILSLDKPLLAYLPLVFVTLLFAIAIKLQKSPFDVATSHHAHQEIVKGVTLEYSGPFLGIIELTHFYETFVLMLVVVFFWATNLWIGTTLSTVAFAFLLILDNATARQTTGWMVKFMWSVPLLLGLCNIIWLYVR